MVVLLTLRADCSLVTLKSAHSTRLLPLLMGILDPELVIWLKVRTNQPQ